MKKISFPKQVGFYATVKERVNQYFIEFCAENPSLSRWAALRWDECVPSPDKAVEYLLYDRETFPPSFC